nr:MAG TPA: hypothetical protein [Caudoviricetes sp.]
MTSSIFLREPLSTLLSKIERSFSAFQESFFSIFYFSGFLSLTPY